MIILLNIKVLLNWIKDISKECGNFIEESRGFFTISFILVFLFEQILFILLINLLFDISLWANTGIGIFALIVITTASFQKFVWEYKFQSSTLQVIAFSVENDMLLSEIGELVDENKKLRKQLKKE